MWVKFDSDWDETEERKPLGVTLQLFKCRNKVELKKTVEIR